MFSVAQTEASERAGCWVELMVYGKFDNVKGLGLSHVFMFSSKGYFRFILLLQ